VHAVEGRHLRGVTGDFTGEASESVHIGGVHLAFKDGGVDSTGFNFKKLGDLNDTLAALGEFATIATKIGGLGASEKTEGHDG
jgi:hypothetical protein